VRYELTYNGWKEEFRPVLKKLSEKDVKLLFSGGKDSSVTMDFMLRAGREFGFSFEAHAGAFPVHRYTAEETKCLESYWRGRGQRIIWHQLDPTDEGIKAAENPCRYCQQLRKNLMKRILFDTVRDWETLTLVISYSIWDIVSYSIEHILGNLYAQTTGNESTGINRRFLETSQRFYPLLRMKEGYMVFRPILRLNTDIIRKIVSYNRIPTLSVLCQFKEYRPKRLLENYYEKMGLRFDYDNVMKFAREALRLPGASSYTRIEKAEYLKNIF